VLGDRLAR
jgi:hypothetical protein